MLQLKYRLGRLKEAEPRPVPPTQAGYQNGGKTSENQSAACGGAAGPSARRRRCGTGAGFPETLTEKAAVAEQTFGATIANLGREEPIMTIQFLCPNGHAIRCSEEQAGRAAKCPKCGVKFRVPRLEDLAGVEPPTAAALSEPPTPVAAEEQIEFLCPNGHRLFGPARLQGQPGQCPECGVKFRIPSYDEIDEEEETSAEQDLIQLSRAEEHTDAGLVLDEGVEAEPIWDESLEGIGPLVARLWERKKQEAVLELEFEDGYTLTPDRFLAASASGAYGLFAVEEPDGTYTLTAIAWSSVRRVRLRGASALPADFQT